MATFLTKLATASVSAFLRYSDLDPRSAKVFGRAVMFYLRRLA